MKYGIPVSPIPRAPRRRPVNGVPKPTQRAVSDSIRIQKIEQSPLIYDPAIRSKLHDEISDDVGRFGGRQWIGFAASIIVQASKFRAQYEKVVVGKLDKVVMKR